MSLRSCLRYAGSPTDAATGAYPLGHGYRWFMPALMRFNAPDDGSPFGHGGLHCYSYCDGDPINRFDPSGHSWETAVREAGLDFHSIRPADAPIGVDVASDAARAASGDMDAPGTSSGTLQRDIAQRKQDLLQQALDAQRNFVPGRDHPDAPSPKRPRLGPSPRALAALAPMPAPPSVGPVPPPLDFRALLDRALNTARTRRAELESTLRMLSPDLAVAELFGYNVSAFVQPVVGWAPQKDFVVNEFAFYLEARAEVARSGRTFHVSQYMALDDFARAMGASPGRYTRVRVRAYWPEMRAPGGGVLFSPDRYRQYLEFFQ
ncbi:RHS repeat-associated core domain-containing protein [Bordetella bronchialis]|nr:RHS repeat-associated core domain-containing protein [Bordetella bronchialis]